MNIKKKKVIVFVAIVFVIILISVIVFTIINKNENNSTNNNNNNLKAQNQQYLEEANQKTFDKVTFSDLRVESREEGKVEIVMKVTNVSNNTVDAFIVNVNVKDGDDEEVYGGAVRELLKGEIAEVRIPAIRQISSNAEITIKAD